MFRVGLTGGIASGKSTVGRLFEALGVPVIDTDELAREVVAPGTALLARIAATFGPDVLTAAGELDRAAMRARVFGHDEARRELQALTHPAIIAEMERRSAIAGGAYQILMIPLLVEGGRVETVDRVLVVDAGEETRIRRVQARDGSTRQHAESILRAQADRDTRLAAAHDVIVNEGDMHALRDQVERLHRQYLHAAANRA